MRTLIVLAALPFSWSPSSGRRRRNPSHYAMIALNS